MYKENKIISEIQKHFSDLSSELEYDNVWQFLVAVILSAQCTDIVVNQITDELFSKYPSVKDFLNLEEKELEKLIYSSGFYKNKAKNILKSARIIKNNFDGKVPSSMDDLLKLPGIGRKSANVILSEYFNKNLGIVVDTHVKRVSRRLNLTSEKSPKKIEKDLMSFFIKKHWSIISSGMVLFGRYICKARNPECDRCNLYEFCEYYKKDKKSITGP